MLTRPNIDQKRLNNVCAILKAERLSGGKRERERERTVHKTELIHGARQKNVLIKQQRRVSTKRVHFRVFSGGIAIYKMM